MIAATVSCGDVARQGSSPVYLVIDTLTGIKGGVTQGSGTTNLISDVVTNVSTPLPCTQTNPCPTIFNDMGSVTLRAPLKDIGATAPLSPTSNNEVTLSRYHVDYIRADGRNTPGVDVPYAFDGAVTGDGAGLGGTATHRLRDWCGSAAKVEAAAGAARGDQSAIIIDVMARRDVLREADRVGNDATGDGNRFGIEFGNFGDF